MVHRIERLASYNNARFLEAEIEVSAIELRTYDQMTQELDLRKLCAFCSALPFSRMSASLEKDRSKGNRGRERRNKPIVDNGAEDVAMMS
jgi:hypothetical protein